MYSDTAVYPVYSKASAESGSLFCIVFVCICRVMAIQVTLACGNGRGATSTSWPRKLPLCRTDLLGKPQILEYGCGVEMHEHLAKSSAMEFLGSLRIS